MDKDFASLAAGFCRRVICAAYPPRCVLCGSPGFDDMDICIHCYLDLPWLTSACAQCALPMATPRDDQLKCGQCLQAPPEFDHSTSLFRYQGDAVRLIHQLKFHAKLANSRLLGKLLATAITQRDSGLPDCIVPVPLSKRRLRQRGFNQSAELARAVSKNCPIPLNLHAIARGRDTRAQTGLHRQQRLKNIRGAFVQLGAVDAGHVAILDDVVTTGSTVNELARVLKRAGVERVDVWSIARAG